MTPGDLVRGDHVAFVGDGLSIFENLAVASGVRLSVEREQTGGRLPEDLVEGSAHTMSEGRVVQLEPAFFVFGGDRNGDSVQELLHKAGLGSDGFFGPFALRNVALDREDGGPAAKLDAAPRRLDWNLRSVASNVRQFEDVDPALHELAGTSLDPRGRLGSVDLGDRHRQELFAAVAETFADSPVDLEEVAVLIVDGHAIGHAVEDDAQLLLRLAHRLIDFVSSRVVANGRDHSNDRAGRVPVRPVGLDNPAVATRTRHHVLEFARRARLARQGPVEIVADAGCHDLWEDLEGALAQNLICRQIRQLLHDRVPNDKSQVGVVDDQSLTGTRDDGLDEGGSVAEGGFGPSCVGHVLDHCHYPRGTDGRKTYEHGSVRGLVVSLERRWLSSRRHDTQSLDQLRPQ